MRICVPADVYPCLRLPAKRFRSPVTAKCCSGFRFGGLSFHHFPSEVWEDLDVMPPLSSTFLVAQPILSLATFFESTASSGAVACFTQIIGACPG